MFGVLSLSRCISAATHFADMFFLFFPMARNNSQISRSPRFSGGHGTRRVSMQRETRSERAPVCVEMVWGFFGWLRDCRTWIPR